MVNSVFDIIDLHESLGGKYHLQIGGGYYEIFANRSGYAWHVLAGFAHLPE